MSEELNYNPTERLVSECKRLIKQVKMNTWIEQDSGVEHNLEMNDAYIGVEAAIEEDWQNDVQAAVHSEAAEDALVKIKSLIPKGTVKKNQKRMRDKIAALKIQMKKLNTRIRKVEKRKGL